MIETNGRYQFLYKLKKLTSITRVSLTFSLDVLLSSPLVTIDPNLNLSRFSFVWKSLQNTNMANTGKNTQKYKDFKGLKAFLINEYLRNTLQRDKNKLEIANSHELKVFLLTHDSFENDSLKRVHLLINKAKVSRTMVDLPTKWGQF